MRTVPFVVDHLDAIAMGATERAADLPTFRSVMKEAPDGPAKTLMDGDNPIGAFGILRIGDDGYSWAVFSDELRGKPFALHRIVKRELHTAATAFRRVYGTVRNGCDHDRRWLEVMGFEKVDDIDLPHGEFERWALKQQ